MKELTIGKLPDNNLVIDNKMVSRHHAKIVMDRGGRYELIDLGSKNGTYVNGRKVRGSQTVKPGDRIVFATSNIPYGWERIFDQIPDDEPELIVNAQTGSSGVDPSILSSVLYDFGKDVDAMFAKQSELFKQIITDYIDNRIPTRSQPTVKQFSEEIFDLLIERYDFWGKQLSMLLNTLEHKSAAFQEEYASDMQKLDTTYQYYLRNSKGEADLTANLGKVDTRKGEMKQQYEALRNAVLPMINALIEDYSAKNPPLFTERMELAPADSALWKELPSPGDDVQKTFYLGDDVSRHIILQEPIELRKRVYGQSLYGGNLLFKYTKKHRQACFDTVNTLICRMLAATPSGNMQVVMVDSSDMEGTCSIFKGMNKRVFKIISYRDDFTKLLNAEASYVEKNIHTLLQGEITNIADYNKTKQEKEPYTILVLKDIPLEGGYGFDDKLVKILRNGPRAGVAVLALVDEEGINQSEESKRGYQYFRNALDSALIKTYEFITPTFENEKSAFSQITHPDSFSNDTITAIVKLINQGLDVKVDTKLKFSDYMPSEIDWWKGKSEKRIDIPFGLTRERKITSLQFTQVNAQNAALVIGKPGSGKSAFLHTIIASTITHYSPKELQLYLLDFSGVEFNIYANHHLPHARVIAPEAEREFGLSVLENVYKEGKDREDIFNEKGVSDIVSMRHENPDAVFPRLLVIIDEFQGLFEIDNDEISKKSQEYITIILNKYRKFGINLILATQKLPSKGIVNYDLIANRIVFDSAPSDFDILIPAWPRSEPKPLFKQGVCVYTNMPDAEEANQTQLTFYIDKDSNDNEKSEREILLEKITAHAKNHAEMVDNNHELVIFRSKELPEFTQRAVADRHKIRKELPNDVGVYLGENIAVEKVHVYVPLMRNNNNNILIIGGYDDNDRRKVAIGIAYHAMMSTITVHTPKSCRILLLNFLEENDNMQKLFSEEMLAELPKDCNFTKVRGTENVKNSLQDIKDEIEARIKDDSRPLSHIFVNIFEFQRGRIFDGTGIHGDRPSECTTLLSYILENGPMVGVFSIIQVDSMVKMKRFGTIDSRVLSLFCHRIALQMSVQDSEKIINNKAASLLKVKNKPRGIYYNTDNNSLTKFKPYKLIEITNQ